MNVFKKHVSILNTAFKWASKSGGKALKKLVNGWKFGPNYRLIVYYTEVDVLELKVCDRLGGKKKRALEERVTEQAAKRISVEEKFKTAREKS